MTPSDNIHYDNEMRCAGTSIYYLLRGNDFSAWHRIKSDEIWHHYKGSTVKIHVINKEGNLSTHLLGDSIKNQAAVFQVVIKAGCWFSAEIEDKNLIASSAAQSTPDLNLKTLN